MSLVGSLEDLGLGDILQIVSLSRKSGLLMIHSEEGEGRIIFCDGLVRAAFVKGEANDLRDLLGDFVPEDEFERAVELAAARGEPLDAIIPECTALTKERLDSLRREHIERAVFRIFSWQGGEFSFEVRDEVEARDAEILLPTGINAQYLTMEATRIDDEEDRSEIEPSADGPDIAREAVVGSEAVVEGEAVVESESVGASSEEPFFSGEAEQIGNDPSANETFTPVEIETVATADPFDPDVSERDTDEIVEVDTDDARCDALEVVALAAAREGDEPDPNLSDDSSPPPSAEPGTGETPRPRPVCLIVIDPELAAAEWQKANLSDLFRRVHIFQSCDAGIARIRQYLARGDLPVALVSNDLSQDPAIGSGDVGEFVQRLKQQAPNMSVLVSWVEGHEPSPVASADAMIRRPNVAFVSGRRSAKILDAAVGNLRRDMIEYLDRASAPGTGAAVAATPNRRAEEPAAGLNRLRETSQRMRDPNTRGEVLSLVLEFASETFSRVAIFMVRDETAVGIAQFGLPSAGGPEDEAFCGIEIPAAEVEWFATVIEKRCAISEAPNGEGDRSLSLRLGDRPPKQAYVAPIESGGRVVALLYADNLPETRPVPDTTILEIVLLEAGLALERALLERALARVEDDA